MKYNDLRDFLSQLERRGDLRRVAVPVSPILEMTDLCDRTLRAHGPALLFEKPVGHSIPVVGNLFGPRAGCSRHGRRLRWCIAEVGELLASLKEPEAPAGLRDALGKVAALKAALWDMAPRTVRSAPCQATVWEGTDVDLSRLPIQTCWPGDAGPLITWGLVITKDPISDARISYLSATGHRAQQADHALAAPSWRRP